MTAGRSLSGKTSGRSIAPVASTTSRARICHKRSRGKIGIGDESASAMRSLSATKFCA